MLNKFLIVAILLSALVACKFEVPGADQNLVNKILCLPYQL